MSYNNLIRRLRTLTLLFFLAHIVDNVKRYTQYTIKVFNDTIQV